MVALRGARARDFDIMSFKMMRVWCDNYCCNRPFDEQTQLKVRLETEAKLRIHYLMRGGSVEYAWSDMLSQEALDNPFLFRRKKILEWRLHAVVDVAIMPEIVASAVELVERGLENANALHLACAGAADCDWFITADSGILKHVRQFGMT